MLSRHRYPVVLFPALSDSLPADRLRGALLACVLLLVSACASQRYVENWPDNTPPQQQFLRAYQADEANQAFQTPESYLIWVGRFYEGRPGVMGWHDMTDVLLDDIPEEHRDHVSDLSRELGRRIAAEWAKDNATRLIDSAMLSLWGSIMVTAETPEMRLEAIEAINRDTRALLNGNLSPEQINDARYAAFDSFN